MDFLQRFLPPSGEGIIRDVINQGRLSWRLLRDPRVNVLYKLIPIGALLYWISPFDFAIPVVDDVAVLWIGNSIFMELCPPEVVAEHRNAIAQGAGADRTHIKIDEGDVIDAEYKEK